METVINREYLENVISENKIDMFVSEIEDNRIELNVKTPQGQDFICEIETEEFKDNLSEYIEDFDVDYETYIWLDETGHGRHGAPYHIKDLLCSTEYVYDQLCLLEDNL